MHATAVENEDRVSQEIVSREKLLNSTRWKQAKLKFDEWLSIQTVYDKDEVMVLESELRNRIAVMSTEELHGFLEEMEAKIAILLSPDTMDARRWVDKYTKQEQKKVLNKFGVQDPMRISALEIEAALQHFKQERDSKRATAAAFNRSRESQAGAARSYHKSQAEHSIAARAASGQRPSYSSPYSPKNSPRKPQTYHAPYHKMNYSVGPWGGVWLSPGGR